MNTENNKMYYEINKKSKGVAYLLWFLLFCIGAHRFYTKNTTSAIVIIILGIGVILSFCLGLSFGMTRSSAALSGTFLLLGTILTIALSVWWLVDAFLTHNNVNLYNTKLAIKTGLLEEDTLYKSKNLL